MNKAIWTCKIGEVEREKLPKGSDAPMRHAVQEAYFKLTGEECKFTFSGWRGEIDEYERYAVEKIK